MNAGNPLSKHTPSHARHAEPALLRRNGSHDPVKAAEVTRNPPTPRNQLRLPVPAVTPLLGSIQEKRGGCQRETKECRRRSLRRSLPRAPGGLGSAALPAPHLEVSSIYI